MAMSNIQNIADMRRAAKRRLPKGLFEFVDRGTEDELTIENNRRVFNETMLAPRALVDVSKRSLSTTVLGCAMRAPLCIAPTAVAGMLWYEGEAALAKAAEAAGIPFCLSTASIASIEDIAAHSSGDLWFQLYLWPDFAMSVELVNRAKAAGYKTLIVTVDLVVLSNREYNRRNGFAIPMRLNARNVIDGALHPRWTLGVMGRYLAKSGVPKFANYPKSLQTDLRGKSGGKAVLFPKNESQNWDHVRRIREIWDGNLIIKGVLRPEDALKAIECGADAIGISNHGGRALDGAVAPLQALPRIVDAVQGRVPLLCDSSVMRGADVVKLLACGASAVMVGRAALWGLAVAGERGAKQALDILTTEIDRVMAYLGCPKVADLDRSAIF
jgi:L-lactate dehydrogenase (cytochrome)/(S)-mandelate dehydrogenase